jgi:hypothetical protein
MSLTKKNNDRCELGFLTFNLGIGANADFQMIAFGGFAEDRLLYFFFDGQMDRFTIESSPKHKKDFPNLRKLWITTKDEHLLFG